VFTHHRLLSPSLAACFLGLLLTACEPPLPKISSEEPAQAISAQDWPAGTVMVVGNEPILASEIESWVDTVALVEPSLSRPNHLRKALTNLVLHKKVARQIMPAECERARQQAMDALEDLRGGNGLSGEGPQVTQVRGAWNDIEQDIGLDRWGAARRENPGEWQLLETLGGWTVMRAPSTPKKWMPNSDVTIDHVTFYYLDPATMKREIEGALEKLPILVIDQEWRDILPVFYDHLVTDETP
jgi:hypothetical protein